MGIDPAKVRGIEIAPLSRATVSKSEGDITYVDRLTHDELCRVHGKAPYLKVEDILPVDVALGDRPLSDAFRDQPKFDYAVGSHVVEHVADLISWLADIRDILKPGGTLRLAIPDRRYTFDYLRTETKASEVLNAYAQRVTMPTSQSVMDHYLNVRKVDFRAAWEGRIDSYTLEPFHTADFAIRAAQGKVDDLNLLDIHCWTFTPQSFVRLMADLAMIDLVPFACEELYQTEPYTFEFFVILRQCADSATINESWRLISDRQPSAQQLTARAAAAQPA